MFFAVIFSAALIFFGDKFSQNPLTVEAFKIYGLSLIPAYINAIMITIFLTVGHVKFSNLLAFLRSFAFLILFLIFAQEYIWWSFLFAEVAALIILIIGGFILSKKENLKTPLLLKLEEFKPSLYFVVNRETGLTDEQRQKLSDFQSNSVAVVEEILKLSSEHSNEKKNNFTAVQLTRAGELVARSNGKLFDYRKLIRADWKFKFILGLNNFYVKI